MIPYDGLLFFYILAAILLGAVIVGLLGKPLKLYGMAATLFMLLLIFDTAEKRLFLAAFFLFELLLAASYFQIRKKSESPVLAWIFVILAILPLILSKAGASINGTLLSFLGISYLTFRAVQVIIETYDGLIQSFSVVDFAYFILFFPTVSSGPIDRYRRFSGDANKTLPREEYAKMAQTGLWKLMSGIFYSLVIGSLINSLWLSKIPEGGFLNTWQYMYAYTFYLFFNFAGYSKMAIGACYFLGVRVPENFNMPFISRDLKDFWSRWHITLSTWFRDYIYTRFAALSLRKKWFKNVHIGSYIGYLITMTVMGFWHGFELHLIAYGIYHGVLMCLNDILDSKWKKFKKIKRDDKWWPVLSLITFHIISFGMLIFSGRLF